MSEDAHSQQIPSRATMFLKLVYLKILYIIEFQFVFILGMLQVFIRVENPMCFTWELPLSRCWKKKIKPLDDKVNSTFFFLNVFTQ